MSTIEVRFWIFLAFITLTSLVAGCSSGYKLPDSVTNPAVIKGDILKNDESEDWSVILNFDVEEVELPRGASSYAATPAYGEEYAKLDLKIKPGIHELKIQRQRRLTNSSTIDWDRLPSIVAELSPGSTHQLTGELIVGSAFKYWIEETITGERVTDVFYDPSGLKEIFSQTSDNDRLSGSHALLVTNQKQLFASKTKLYPDHDCFNLITEVIVDPEMAALSVALFIFVGDIYFGEPGYRVYEDICIEVKEGHLYTLKHHYKKGSGPCYEDDPLGWEEGDFCPLDEFWYEIWDMTDKQLLIKFALDDLEVILDRVE